MAKRSNHPNKQGSIGFLKGKLKRNIKKNILPVIFLWIILLIFINFFSPEIFLFVSIFYLLLFFSIYSAINLFTYHRRAFVWTLIIVAYLVMRQTDLDNYLNLILLAGIFITLDIYCKKR